MCAATRAQGQQFANPVRLLVSVQDAEQRAIPGATCLLFSPAEPTAAVASVTTDERGVAAFPLSLPPATYTLRVEAKGFEPLTRASIVIKEGPPSEIVLTLAVASVAEDVTVATPEETMSVEAGASPPAGNLRREALRRLPLATARVDEALPLIPGVVRSATGEISIDGANEQQSALLVNGLNAADPASGNFRLNLPIDSVESVQVFQHPYTAEFGQFTGGLTQIETRRGGENWHAEFNDFLPDVRFKGGHLVGIAEDVPRLNFNGPLLKDRLFVAQSLSYTIAKQPVRGLAFPFNETKTEAQSYFTQLDLLLSSRHTQTFTFGFFPERDQFVNLDFFRPQPVTPNYKQKDFVVTARDHYQFGNGGLLQSAFSFKHFNADVWGQGEAEQTLTPTVEQGNYFATQSRRSHRLELFEVYTSPAIHFLRVAHEIKVGFDFNSISGLLNFAARPVNITRADGTLAERIVFRGVRPINASNREYVGFGQERLLVRPNLSFDLGLRYENQQIADESNLAPRAGLAWSPFKGDRTVLRGGIGLFYDKVPLNIRSFARYPARTVTRYAADGETVLDSHHFVNILVAEAPIEPLDFRRRSTDGGFVPENLKWNVQLDQLVAPWLNLRANLTSSRTDHIYIVNPELDFRGRSGIVLRSAGQATYRALELTARFSLPHKDQFFVSYVRSRARGDLNDFNSYFGDIGAPVIRANQYSNLPFDVPNRLLAWGTLTLPHRIMLAPIFEARTGFPYSVRDAEQNFVDMRNADRTRFPAFISLDAELAKEFQVTKKYGVRLSLRVFNLTDHFNPRDVRANTGDPRFGEFFAPYHRFFTGGFDIIF